MQTERTPDFFVEEHPAQLVEDPDSPFENYTLSQIEKRVQVGNYFPARLTIEGKPLVIRKIQKIVEELRVLFNKHLDSFHPLHLSLVHLNAEYLLRETKDVLDCRDWEMHTGIPDPYFDSYVEPVLPILSHTLNMSMSPIGSKKTDVRLTDQITTTITSKVFTIIPYNHSF